MGNEQRVDNGEQEGNDFSNEVLLCSEGRHPHGYAKNDKKNRSWHAILGYVLEEVSHFRSLRCWRLDRFAVGTLTLFAVRP